MTGFFDLHGDKIVQVSESGCMIWTGATTPKGYGLVQTGEMTPKGKPKPSYTHRIAYVASGKAPAEPQVVRHTCDVRCCVNPDHLVAGTPLDNSRDMVGRGRSLKGERQPNALLSDAEVLIIKERHRAGETIASIARDFPVHVETVRKAAKKTSWRHIA